MVGLSVVLESEKPGFSNETHQVINKTTLILNHKTSSSSSSSSSSPSPPPPPPPPSSSSSSSSSSSFCLNSHNSFPQEPTFLDKCFLCRKRLLPGKDIYMYKGDRAFCSVECRCKQIFMDEEESIHKENCSLAAMRPTSSNSSSSSPSSPLKGRHHQRKGARNRAAAAGGGFAY